MRKVVYLVSLLFSHGVLAVDDCNIIVGEIIASAQPKDVKIKKIELLKDKCGGTGSYEYNLGIMYLLSDDIIKAYEIFHKGITYKTKYTRDLRFGLIEVLIHQAELRKAVGELEGLSKEFPKWYKPYGRAGQLQIDLSDYDTAIKNLETANGIYKTAVAYAGLSVAYFNKERHGDSANAMSVALEMDSGYAACKQCMNAAAMSLYTLKDYKRAGKIMVLWAKADKNIVHDMDFQKLYKLLDTHLSDLKGL